MARKTIVAIAIPRYARDFRNKLHSELQKKPYFVTTFAVATFSARS